MTRKLTIVAMVVLVAILIASPVFAVSPSNAREVANTASIQQPTIISMTATINEDKVSTDTDTGQFEVAIRMTNKAFIQYRGDVVWVNIVAETVCVEWLIAQKSKPIDCASIDQYDKVSINAKVDPETKIFTARRVTLKQPRIQIP